MTEYLVKIDERFFHTFVVEAASEEEALETGYQLLRDGMTPEEEAARDYDLESDGFTGDHSVWEK
jgi:hypothetical protein